MNGINCLQIVCMLVHVLSSVNMFKNRIDKYPIRGTHRKVHLDS